MAGDGNVFAGAPAYVQTRAGTEIDLKLVYAVTAVQGLNVTGLYGLFKPGAAVTERNAGKADQAKFAYVMAQYMF